MRTSRSSPSLAVLFHENVALCWSTLECLPGFLLPETATC